MIIRIYNRKGDVGMYEPIHIILKYTDIGFVESRDIIYPLCRDVKRPHIGVEKVEYVDLDITYSGGPDWFIDEMISLGWRVESLVEIRNNKINEILKEL